MNDGIDALKKELEELQADLEEKRAVFNASICDQLVREKALKMKIRAAVASAARWQSPDRQKVLAQQEADIQEFLRPWNYGGPRPYGRPIVAAVKKKFRVDKKRAIYLISKVFSYDEQGRKLTDA